MKFSLRNLKTRSAGRPSRILRFITFVSRLLQSCSSVIVIALASYFIRDFHQSGEHIYYQEIVVSTPPHLLVLSVLFG